MTIILIISACIGVLQGYLAISKAHMGLGDNIVKPSSSLIEFIFLNK